MKVESKDLKEQMYDWMVSELEMADAAGVAFCLDGEPYSMDEKESLHRVLEDSYYMKNYTENDAGHIIQIDFIQIKSV